MSRVKVTTERIGDGLRIHAGEFYAEFHPAHDMGLARAAGRSLIELAAGFSEADIAAAVFRARSEK